MKERIERLTREIEARNAACKQYAYDIACLNDKVRALQVKIDNFTSFGRKAVTGRDHHGTSNIGVPFSVARVSPVISICVDSGRE